uniref:CPBP family glutamic-type intramembrane protease n=1 Tax=uncultured Ruminococcus sp. TaxID=165186 RepID=UPI0025EFC4AD
DYPGFPYAGILAMCAACIPMSYMLTWMTEKTKSVYPAMICHMMIDNVMNIPVLAMADKDVLDDNSLMIGLLVMGLVPTIFTAVMIVSKLTAAKKCEA